MSEIVTSDAIGNIKIDNPDPEKTQYEAKKADEKLVLDGNCYSENQIMNLSDMFKELLAGNTDVMKSAEFEKLGFNNIKMALEFLSKNNKLDQKTVLKLLTEGWRLTYRAKPPTPAEFLTPYYIGDQANTLYPHIRKTFCEFLEPSAPYRNLILSSCIGTGKSQPLDAKVYVTKDRYVSMGDIQPGDMVLTPDGTQTEVIATMDWAPEDVYEIELEDGSTMRCGLHHLHHVFWQRDEYGEPVWANVETGFLLEHPDYDFTFGTVEVSEGSS